MSMWSFCVDHLLLSRHRLSEFIWVPALLCLEGLNSLVSSISSSFHPLSASFSTGFLEPGWKGLVENTPFMDDCSDVSHSLLIVYLWVTTLFPIYSRRKLFWRWLNKTKFYTYSRMSLEVILLLCSLNRTKMFDFFLSSSKQLSQLQGSHVLSTTWWKGPYCLRQHLYNLLNKERFIWYLPRGSTHTD